MGTIYACKTVDSATPNKNFSFPLHFVIPASHFLRVFILDIQEFKSSWGDLVDSKYTYYVMAQTVHWGNPFSNFSLSKALKFLARDELIFHTQDSHFIPLMQLYYTIYVYNRIERAISQKFLFFFNCRFCPFTIDYVKDLTILSNFIIKSEIWISKNIE